MTILPREGSIAPPAEDDDTPDHRASVAEAAGQPAFESPPERSGEPEEHGNDRGQDQRLGGTHPAGLYPLPEAEPTVHAACTHGRCARACLDAQEQDRLGLDELDQVQLRLADGWVVCTEKSAPAAVAVQETPAETLIPGSAAQGPE